LRYGSDGQSFCFYYFRDLPLEEQIETPVVTWLWGQGLSEADRLLATQFDRYEEPPSWWFHTTWFWLHPNWQRGSSFARMGEGARILMEKGGINGFGLFTHEVPWSGHDVDVGSPLPNPSLGGPAALREALRPIREQGGHTYVWMSRSAARRDGLEWQESWAIRGMDGRPVRIHNRPDGGVRMDVVNSADPTFEAHLREWIAFYIQEMGVTGLFWDSGAQPLPPDFGGKPYLRWPGETSARVLAFYERIYRFGRSLNPDFFMWVEGISVDLPMNAFAVDSRIVGPYSSQRLMHRLAFAGPRRLAWRSGWRHDLASGFPFVDPPSDIGWRWDPDRYEAVARDPVNAWIARMVRERGTRQAVGLADGISRLDEFVVVSPGATGTLEVPESQLQGSRLQHELNSSIRIVGRKCPAGLRFRIPAAGPWRFIP
jgi:hypothetical protein